MNVLKIKFRTNEIFPVFIITTFCTKKKTSHIVQNEDRKEDPNLGLAFNFLDIYYWTQKLRYATALLTHRRIVDVREESFSILSKDELINIEQNLEKLDPIVQMHFLAYKVIESPEIHGNYILLDEKLQKYGAKYDKQMVEQLYRCNLNFCIYQINKGVKKFEERLAKVI